MTLEIPKTQDQQALRWKRKVDPIKDQRLLRLYWQYRYEPVWSMTARDEVTGWWRRWLNMIGPLRCWNWNKLITPVEILVSTTVNPEPFCIEPTFDALGKYQFATRHGKGFYTESIPDLDEPEIIERVNVELGRLKSCDIRLACTSRLGKVFRVAVDDNSVWRLRPPYNDENNPLAD